jgi:hypothetical protein
LIFRAPGEQRGALINHQDRAEIRRLLGLADRWLAVRRIGNQMGRESSAHPKLVRDTLRAAHGVVPVQIAIFEGLIGEARKVPLGLMVQAGNRRGRASGRGRVHRTARLLPQRAAPWHCSARLRQPWSNSHAIGPGPAIIRGSRMSARSPCGLALNHRDRRSSASGCCPQGLRAASTCGMNRAVTAAVLGTNDEQSAECQRIPAWR